MWNEKLKYPKDNIYLKRISKTNNTVVLMEKHSQMLKSYKKQLNYDYILTSRANTFIFS